VLIYRGSQGAGKSDYRDKKEARCSVKEGPDGSKRESIGAVQEGLNKQVRLYLNKDVKAALQEGYIQEETAKGTPYREIPRAA